MSAHNRRIQHRERSQIIVSFAEIAQTGSRIPVDQKLPSFLHRPKAIVYFEQMYHYLNSVHRKFFFCIWYVEILILARRPVIRGTKKFTREAF
jgi:hypothetical protein